MKQITKEKTKYFEYLFAFDYSLDILEFCRHLKKKHGFRHFGYVPEKKAWGFNNSTIIDEIKSRYSDAAISSDATNASEQAKLELAADELLVKNVNRIKRAKTSK